MRCAVVGVFLAAASATGAFAQAGPAPVEMQVLEGVVERVLDDRDLVGPDGFRQPFQRLEVRLLEDPGRGTLVAVDNGQVQRVGVLRFERGDRVMVTPVRRSNGVVAYEIVDAVRRDALLLLAATFVVLTLAVARLRGAASLLSMALSFLLLFTFVLPRISAGADPILVTIAAATVIIPTSFYLSHGLSRKTTAAVAGTLAALLVTGALARVTTRAARLSGLSSDEAMFLQASAGADFDMRGLLLASILIGLLGILDDVTISQAAVVNQLRSASPHMPVRELVRRAMDVGTDHIASLVNTLVLVYTSTALPLILLFTSGQAPFREVVNYEIVAEEIVRTLVASIGLILAVPVTTVIAAFYVGGAPKDAPRS